jgi:hypothetical protein
MFFEDKMQAVQRDTLKVAAEQDREPTLAELTEELQHNNIFNRFIKLGIAESRITKLCAEGLQEYTKQHKSEPTDEELLVSTIKKQNKE